MDTTTEKDLSVQYLDIYNKYRDYTMIPEKVYVANLELCSRFIEENGCIVECGVWRGGMIAGISELLGDNRQYVLFDSFEGLPPAKRIDGPAAISWQSNKDSPYYFDNCRADIEHAHQAMNISGTKSYKIVKGWFSETLPEFYFRDKIDILRLDADWYNSISECLNILYPQVRAGGLIIIDDYYTWDGCSVAVHEYLAKKRLSDRIYQHPSDVCYIIKK
jgi:O-methyltransferase